MKLWGVPTPNLKKCFGMAGLKLGWMIETAWQSASPTGIFEQNLFWGWDTSELHWEIPLKKLTFKTPSNPPNQVSRFSVWLRFTPQPQNSNQLGTWKYKILSLNYFLRPISFHPFTNGQTLRSGWEFSFRRTRTYFAHWHLSAPCIKFTFWLA